mmetsp:Transcript_30628/g.45319  ORF Transcript_30628/g.45319 Transcript_30628/m.45319 type:complete len:387 (+) Transcript_30628:50-1210(+)
MEAFVILIFLLSTGFGTSFSSSNDVSSSIQRIFTTTQEAFQAPPTALSITTTTDTILSIKDDDLESKVTKVLLEQARSYKLNRLLREDYDTYVTTATFLSNKIPREAFPNIQDIPHPQSQGDDNTETKEQDYLGRELVADCTVADVPVGENPIEAAILELTRNIYSEKTGIPRSSQKGIIGLIDEMQAFMLSPKGADPKVQQERLLQTLYTLMTPVLPPFYRLFMGWKVPSTAAGDPEWLVNLGQRLNLEEGKSYGPAPYAPLLTSIVAPFVFGFLVGPARINLRNDGSYGGLVVNKCKFLQESNCKGMCLHSCKLPAQQLFDELGLPLRVIPNFDSQECQWSFGEIAPPVESDDKWPQGCLQGCTTRRTLADLKTKGEAELANCY